ncbi:MAG: hypothetical protein H9777_07275, partial [Candidatus Phocaeicola faecigallinarum]|nr:hypothetical protein [Candidatus Phocaeicola faecigallinarum]
GFGFFFFCHALIMVPLHCFQHFLETAESGYYIILDLPERLPLFRDLHPLANTHAERTRKNP